MRHFPQAACILLCLYLCLSVYPPSAIAANEDTQQLLQKGLTVFEIDQELGRIEEQQKTLKLQMASTEQQLTQQQARSIETKQHAGKVLRAYYMGDRDSLWMLLFSITSFKDALSTFEYLQMIVMSDHETLQRHLNNQKELQKLNASLLSSQATLQETKDRYIAQRAQQVLLQKQLDEGLAKQASSAVVIQEITKLTVQWQDKGIPLFKTYFRALAQAMNQLPEIINDTSGGKSNHLIMNGFQYTFQITDQELNTFLRSKNPLFQNMTFRFYESKVIAKGKQDDMEVMIKGAYDIATKDTLKGKYIRFNLEQLQFNGFDLPQSTIDSMIKDFDFGIYPQSIASFLQVTDVRLDEGKLSIMLKLAL
ncbi:hypothetical protein [Paenibacillus sp. UNC451MF]|uniref:hypothetical protein n=1 Tax=Paenibacillus sp. UNC451MF TaxID=1449063 RepID=UPI00048AF699|nr:hypothetical protein [Paenibacillus sp. UNC451MF]